LSSSLEPLTHQPKNHPEWNESYYLCFSDRKNQLSGMTRLGFKPNKGEAMAFFLLFLRDGSVAGYQTVEAIKGYPARLKAGGMVHEIQPEGSCRYRFDGKMAVTKDPESFPKAREHPELISKVLPVRMDLRFTPLNQTYEYSEHMTPESLELGRKSGDEHWEQIALMNGEIALGDEVCILDNVMGQRDHTHGVRDWTGVGNWLYYVVWFNTELAVNPAAIVADDGRISTGGFLFKNGRNIPIKSMKIIGQKFRDGILPVSSELQLEDADKVMHILKGKAGPVVPLPFKDEHGNVSVLAQSFGSFELDGVQGGYGGFETLRVVQRSTRSTCGNDALI